MMRTTKMIQNRFRYLRLIMPKMIESLVDSKRSKRSRMTLKIFSIHYVYPTYITIRFIIGALIQISGEYKAFLKYDLFMEHFISTGFFDPQLCIVAATMPIMLIYYHYLVNFTIEKQTWKYMYDITFNNRILFFQFNPQFNRWTLVKLWHSNSVQIKFHYEKLKYFPDLNKTIRVRLVCICEIFELFFSVFLILMGKLIS